MQFLKSCRNYIKQETVCFIILDIIREAKINKHGDLNILETGKACKKCEVASPSLVSLLKKLK